MLDGAAAGLADKAGRVAVVDHHHRAVLVGQIADGLERRDVAVHREHAVGRDELDAAILGELELATQIVEIEVLVAEALGLREPDAVDDAGVVEGVGDDRVFFAEDGLEQTAVCVKAGGVQDGVFGAEERRDLRLQRLVDVLRAADEAHAGQTETVAVHRVFCGLNQLGRVGETEVIIGAEAEHFGAASHLDVRALRRDDHALALVGASLTDGGKISQQLFTKGGVHRSSGRGDTSIKNLRVRAILSPFIAHSLRDGIDPPDVYRYP